MIDPGIRTASIRQKKATEAERYIESKLLNRLRSGKNLLYLASGTHVNEAYHELPYDNVVLVDRCSTPSIEVIGKVVKLGLFALEACTMFRKLDIKFDAFVCINEGLFEGGGYYPIHCNWSMGTILPVMKDEYLHFACPSYYGSGQWKRMFNLPQGVELVKADDPAYINPSIFVRYGRLGEKSFVWRVKKAPGEQKHFMLGSRKVTVQRGNIFDDYDRLDSLFVRCQSQEEENLSRLAPKVQYLFKRTWKFSGSRDEILNYCMKNKIEKLGLTPWLKGEYNDFLQFMEERDEKDGYAHPREIHFYHLHQNDFKQLYERAEKS